MLRAASKSLARYSTLRRRPVCLNGLRLYSLDSSNHTPETTSTAAQDVQEPGPSNATPAHSNEEHSLTQSGKKTRRIKKLKSKRPPIQEQITSGGSFTQIQMESTSSEPTLDDLLALKPATLPDAAKFGYPERYKKVYDKTLRTINRAFTEDQIHGFLTELNPGTQSLPRTKAASISFLVQNNWNMPAPQGVSPKDRKPKTEEIILNPERLVVLLGKNGGGLRTLSTQLKVKIRPLPEKFGIEVTGRPEQISAVRLHLNQLRRTFRFKAAFAPTYCKRSPRGLVLMSDRKMLKSLAAELDTSSESYAAFPFLSSQTLPWTAGQSTVRVWTGEGTQQTIKSVLLDGLPPLPKGHFRRIEARTGHVLTSNRQSTGLFPATPASLSPLTPFKKLLDQDKRTFVHSTSPSEIGSTSSQRTYRLVYQAGLSPMKGEGPPSKPSLRSQLVVEFIQRDDNAVAVKSRLGTLSRVDLACPDRALDMSFTAFDYKVLLLEDIPQSLKRFAGKLPESYEKLGEIPRPDGLSSVVLGNTTYYLQSSSLVQVDTSVHEGDSKEFTERTTDLDSRITTATTLCVGVDTDAGWKTFVEQCKKAVTRPFYRPQAKFVPYRPSLVDE
ncbi:hypothetical protein FS837_007441 [Tulasnella sp. UAMH 9824]|nr:hypothetical protein FS837_007441 [Tulasnella sp. UAMH 9824]